MADWQITQRGRGDKKLARIDGLSALVMADGFNAGRFGYIVRGKGGSVVAKQFRLPSEAAACLAAERAATSAARRIRLDEKLALSLSRGATLAARDASAEAMPDSEGEKRRYLREAMDVFVGALESA